LQASIFNLNKQNTATAANIINTTANLSQKLVH